MENPKRCKLTIGIPIYNGGKNLREKINSILKIVHI